MRASGGVWDAWRAARVLATAWCAVLQSLVPSLGAQAPGRVEEVGTVRWGSAVVWLRATDSGTVEVFGSAGYRNALAQPVGLSPDEVEQWALALDSLGHPQAVALVQQPQLALGSGELVLDMAAAASTSPQLRVWIAANRPDPVVAVIFPQAAQEGAAILRDAARRARALQIAAVTPAGNGGMPGAGEHEASNRGADSAPPGAPMSVNAPAFPATRSQGLVDGTKSLVTATVPLAHSTSAAPTFSPATGRAARHVRPATDVLPVLSTKTSKPLRVVAQPLGTGVHADSTPRLGNGSGSAAAGVGTPTGGAQGDAAGVEDAAVQNLVAQWRPELMYCFTQYGLREHADLMGAVAVQFTIAPTGTVGHTAIASHRWNGEGGSDVESCIRTRIAGWHFPPASTGSVHEFSMDFGSR